MSYDNDHSMVKNKIKTSLLIVFIGVINLLVHFGCPPLTMNAVSATIVNGGELFVKTDVQKRSEMQLQPNCFQDLRWS